MLPSDFDTKFPKQAFYEFKGTDIKSLSMLRDKEKEGLILNLFKHQMLEELVSILNEDLGFDLRHLDVSFIRLQIPRLIDLSTDKVHKLILERFNSYDTLYFLVSSLDYSDFEVYKKIVNLGFSIDLDMIQICFNHKNYRFLDFIFQQIDPSFLKNNSDFFLENLLRSEDSTVTLLFTNALRSKHIFDYGKHVSEDMLRQAISEGRTEFIKWALDNGKESEAICDHLKTSLETYNLPVIKTLFSYIVKKKAIEKKNYLEILGFKKSSDQNEFLLLAYAMHSPLDEIAYIVHAFPFLNPLLPGTLKLLALMVRFPIYYQKDVNTASHTTQAFETPPPPIKDYVRSSKMYAQQNLKDMEAIVTELPQLSHADLMNKIVQHRITAFHSQNSKMAEYKERIIDDPKSILPSVTDLLIHDNDENDNYSVDGRKWYSNGFRDKCSENSCYWHSLRHFSRLAFSLENVSILKKYSSLRQVIFNDWLNVDFNYLDESGNALFCRTQLYGFIKWIHPLFDVINKAQEPLEKLHKELLDINLPKKDRKLFDEKIARYYYLIATLSEYSRGTPHNAMMVLNIYYAYHKLPPPIPKLEHFFLDNTMLMLPIEEVILKWNTYFETVSQLK
jgi:hypothetical protein